MKKSMFLLGIAAAALASCTNEEVVEVAQNRAIGFSSYVNNTTRAVTPTDELNDGDYYVIGYYGSTAYSNDNNVFNNEANTMEYYWQAGNHYQFASYSDGTNRIASGVTFAPGNPGSLVIADYTVNDSKDLLGAISSDVECTDASSMDAVPLTFKHLLSKVRFTFSTAIGENYTLAISDLKFNAISTATATFNGTSATWNGNTKADYIYPNEITDLCQVDNLNADGNLYTQAVEKFVIPQDVPASGTQIQASFTATLTGDGISGGTASKTFNATLTVPTTNAWQSGTIYNYTTTLTADQITDDLEYPILFEVTEITDWSTPINVPITPVAQ
ncbi:fimbrillin family protein [Bacteroides gallinaceum]|uniref:fimbrillin family protein n=1 Tax=Bacteroides gallinaceum TaxID=1462571 RepID=UPI0025AAE7DA|nr:fimbrillin family protein [Bacteroides gallinaceum]MDN0067044.1 fimbrillin family protein [Bacteroides gallinaceum]